MDRWTLFARIFLSLSLGAVLFGVPGCGQTDLSHYQPARNYKDSAPGDSTSDDASKTIEATSDSESVAGSNQTPEPVPETKFTEADLPPVSALIPVNVVDGADVRSIVTASNLDNAPGTGLPAAAGDPSGKPAASTEPRKIELLIKEKTFRPDRKTGALLLTFEDLDMEKVLNMTEITENAEQLMPEWLTGLKGKRVRIRGFMVPTFVAEGIERFVLARDNQACCFGPNPKIDYLAQVDLKPGKTTNYIPATVAFDVVGKFNIEIKGEQGKLYQMYFIEDAEIIAR